MKGVRVALVHDYLVQFGGAERVLQVLMELFPHAPVFTLLYDRAAPGISIDERRLRTSWLQRVPGARRHHRYFPLLMPMAIEHFDLSEYDIVFSVTHSFGKGVLTGPATMHVSYCFTPTRYLWDDSHRYVQEFSRLALFRRLAPLALSSIRLWDYLAAQRVNYYLTSSRFVAGRIRKYYRREAQVIPPPVEIDKYSVSGTVGDYYLVVARLVPYKRVELAVAACRRLKRPLKIVGTGPEYADLRRAAGKETEFLGFVSDGELPQLYAGARALLFPQEEDFGLTPLEAAASGKPTIAYAAGGALETVVPGLTGTFFGKQSVPALMAAMQQSEKTVFDPFRIRQHALGYSREEFLRRIEASVHTHWMHYQEQFTTRKNNVGTSSYQHRQTSDTVGEKRDRSLRGDNARV